MKQIRILYVDSDLNAAGQLLRHFNPPQYLTPELAGRSGNKDISYQFIFLHCRTYELALRTLVAYNADPLAKKRGLMPFDTIFLETKKRIDSQKYSWLNFLEDISQLGTQPERLNLPYGLLAFGSQSSEAIKEQLMYFGVRQFIKKPFSLEEMETTLQTYFDTIFGSSRFYLEERPEPGAGIIRRVIRYFNRSGSLTGIHLPYLQQEQEGGKTTLWLRSGSEVNQGATALESNCVAIVDENAALTEILLKGQDGAASEESFS